MTHRARHTHAVVYLRTPRPNVSCVRKNGPDNFTCRRRRDNRAGHVQRRRRKTRTDPASVYSRLRRGAGGQWTRRLRNSSGRSRFQRVRISVTFGSFGIFFEHERIGRRKFRIGQFTRRTEPTTRLSISSRAIS